MVRLVLGLLSLTAACYDPDLECPRCPPVVSVTPIGAEVDASISSAPDGTAAPDAAPPADAATPPPPVMTCAPGCSGTCDDGVCVIACVGEQACSAEVVCPLTGPCRVTCSGKKACDKGVRCGLGRCEVMCNGQDACHKRVRCESACACDVMCGPGACKDDAVCPSAACEAGAGCTSNGGCDDC